MPYAYLGTDTYTAFAYLDTRASTDARVRCYQGTMDANNQPFWIDVAKYKDVIIRGGYPQDLAG